MRSGDYQKAQKLYESLKGPADPPWRMLPHSEKYRGCNCEQKWIEAVRSMGD